jgi:hypothetical protein
MDRRQKGWNKMSLDKTVQNDRTDISNRTKRWGPTWAERVDGLDARKSAAVTIPIRRASA